MKAIMVMFDSLNRRMLPPYQCDWVHAPNFARLAERTVVFDNAYVGSLPCMPARRELHTGRYNFMHRGWGPIEPFDQSMPEILKKNGVYTHLVSDHQHYWEDGGATYHTRYSSWEVSRGQEGDPWKGHVKDPDYPETEVKEMRNSPLFRQDLINRTYYETEDKHPQAVTFELGMEFIEKNKDEDNWFLQIETFDPHEPFFSYQHYKDLYPHEYTGKHIDWPPYYFVRESEEVVQHVNYEYAALLSMCDHYLGKVLDMMDRYDMWKDTMLIVNTDHGYLLGEHGWWSKSVMPVYQEIAHIPLFIWDPRSGKRNERRQSIVQTIDLAPTLLEFFNVRIPDEMQGEPLRDVIANDQPVRDAALFGYHGGHINITDGRYVYMMGPVSPSNGPLYEYTLMPTRMRELFSVNDLQNITLQEPFSFTQGCQLMKIEASHTFLNPFQYGSKLFDVQEDPEQKRELEDDDVELAMIKKMATLMRENDAPLEQYERLGIPYDGEMTVQQLREQKAQILQAQRLDILQSCKWSTGSQNQVRAILNLTPEPQRASVLESFEAYVNDRSIEEIDEQVVTEYVEQAYEQEEREKMLYFVGLAGRTS